MTCKSYLYKFFYKSRFNYWNYYDDCPKTLLRDKQEITEQKEIPNYFNIFSTNIGSNLASKILIVKNILPRTLKNLILYSRMTI